MNNIEFWEKKLLDIGKRNQLINYKNRLSSTLEFYVNDMFVFYNDFISFKKYEVANLFESFDSQILMSDFSDYEDPLDIKNTVIKACGEMVVKKDIYTREEIDNIKKRFIEKPKRNYLYTSTIYNKYLNVISLLKRNQHIFHEENGIETLYMCFSFLRYFENDNEYFAPIALLPTKIINKKLNDIYYIQANDDSFLENENLVLKFKLDYGIDIKKPTDDISLKEYIEYVKDKVLSLNFSVINQVSLAIFSFSKIMMYKDISQNKEKVLNNKIISSIINNKKLADIDLIKDENYNDKSLVMLADESQYNAINYAKQGKSFVLQGPPGTGKSQTITNIIASLIKDGKKVLFVCEKTSALNVVYNNLKKCNLDLYALPIYDLKMSKKEVINNIYSNIKNIENDYIKLSKSGKNLLLDMDYYKSFFDIYKSELNKKRIFGYNILEIISFSLLDAHKLEFNINDYDNFSKYSYDKILDKLKNIKDLLTTFKTKPIENPFYGVNLTLKKDSSKVNELVNVTYNSLKKIYEFKYEINSALFKPKRLDNLLVWIKAFNFKNNFYNLEYKSFFINDLNDCLEKLNYIEKEYENINLSRAYLLNKYDKGIFNIDYKTLYDSVKKSNKLNFDLSKYLVKPIKLKKKDIENDLKLLNDLDESYLNVAINENILLSNFPKLYFSSKTDFKRLKKIIKYLIDFNDIANLLQEEISKESLVKAIILEKTGNFSVEKEILDFNFNFNNLKSYFSFDSINIDFDSLYIKLKNMYENKDSLIEYTSLNNTFLKADKTIQTIKEYIFSIDYSDINLDKIFIKSFFSNYLKYLFQNDYYLKSICFYDFKKNIIDYQNNYSNYLNINKIRIKESITENWPALNDLMKNNFEVKILTDESMKKRKIMSISKLLNLIPNLIFKLKPVFMMSPLTVSTYLNSDMKFDCVIFDESSQISIENSINCIYRANQLIVVGDTEQLPPTSFFNQDLIEKSKSILDVSTKIMPKIMLKWHYRSRDEKLITFSNNMIYHNLITFPSNSLNSSDILNYVYVENGVYKHIDAFNYNEALKVVDLVYYMFRHFPNKSVGVVTFNISQEKLIRRIIMKKRIKSALYEDYFTKENEAFFIKNIESVQGDERDIIILSSTFGFDENNKMSLNFGPINKANGYKRLNVAISRSRERMYLVTSLKPEDFVNKKIKSKGAKMFIDFISFVKNISINKTFSKSHDIFINKICSIFIENGFDTITNFGSSNFKIDVAVIDKENNNNLIAGILTDSLNNFLSASDKYILLNNVLSKRGFRVYYLSNLLSYKDLNDRILEMIKSFGKTKEEIAKIDFTEKKDNKIIELDSLFTAYPNIYSVIKEVENCVDKNSIYSIIQKMSPISVQDTYKFITTSLNIEKNELDKIIDRLKNEKKIYQIRNFLMKPDDIFFVKFRKYDRLNQYNRFVENIYIEELEDGFMTIIEYVKEIDKTVLYSNINILLGYPSNSKRTISKFDTVVRDLVEKKLIIVYNSIIKFVK